MASKELGTRTKAFALRVIELVNNLSKSRTSDVLGNQLLRCGTSVGANYRAASCAKSRADFISKMSIVHEEADESLYWMELLVEGKIVQAHELSSLREECQSIVAMVVASIKTARNGPSK